MMKRGILSMLRRAAVRLLLLFAFLTVETHGRASQQDRASQQGGSVCRLGFTYEISESNHWGKGKPVIKTVIPYTPAEQAGVAGYDIIEAIDGVATETLRAEELTQMLNPVGKNEVVLTLKNLSSPSKQTLVKKECKMANAITEDQLAAAFSMYSLETTTEREFTCPFKTTVTPDTVDFASFTTFAFTPLDENNARLESAINDAIEKELTKKGLVVDAEQPDILVQTFYFFDKNPNYTGLNKVVVKNDPIFRYNFTRSKMETFPFLDPASAEAEAEYLLQFGIRLIDQRDVPGRVLWECEANELMTDSYRLDDYARIHVPLMCMQYPFMCNVETHSRASVRYTVSKKSYNYTGISYDIDRLDYVVDVNRNSPAYAAGIRPRDIVEKIDRHEMGYTAEEFSEAYKTFILNTMRYRNPNTCFRDANGFRYCMLWDTSKYAQVADAIHNPEYLAAFSYLYNFAPYVNPSDNNACTFYIERGKKKMEVIIRPTIRSEVMIEIK